MIITGGLGGLANYLTTQLNDDEKHPMAKRVTVGAIAAVAVPAFLTLISSSIISDSMSQTDYFVFAGFCLLAGFSSKAFLTSMSKGLLDRVKNVEERQSTLESEVEPVLEKETELDEEEASEISALSLTESDKSVLNALANPKYTRRYLTGVVAETKLARSIVLDSLNKLRAQDLVRYRANKGELYWLTHFGRRTARDMDR